MNDMRKHPHTIRTQKSGRKIVCLTAYSAPMAAILDQHCDLLLVGDSLGMALYGMDSTLGVTLDMMIAHGKAVMRTAKTACVIVDMPYGSYESSPALALENARRIMAETGCDGVKLEGGQDMEDTIAQLVQSNIPVMAHIGLQPQSVEKEGGYRVKGKKTDEIEQLMADAKAIERAGAFCVVIEGTIETVARDISTQISTPTIGIGASPACDGQILVSEDMLGLTQGHTAKFVKKYANLAKIIDEAAASYAAQVHEGSFPSPEYTYQTKIPQKQNS